MKKIILVLALLTIGCSSRFISMAQARIPAPTKPRIYFAAGDSVTDGRNASDAAHCFVNLLTDFFNIWYPNTTTVNGGFSGITAEAYVPVAIQYRNQLGNAPDLCTIFFGINDLVRAPGDIPPGVYGLPCTEAVLESYVFKDSLKQIIETFQGQGSKMAIATIYHFDRLNGWADGDKVWVEYNKRIQEAAAEEGIGLVDLVTPFDGHPGYLEDVHPNNQGHAVIEHAFEGAF